MDRAGRIRSSWEEVTVRGASCIVEGFKQKFSSILTVHNSKFHIETGILAKTRVVEGQKIYNIGIGQKLI